MASLGGLIVGPDSQGGGATQLYASIIAIAVAVAIVAWRNRRPQKLRMERLWVRPMLFALIIAASLVSSPAPLTAVSIGLLFIAVAIGAGLGWQRGRFMRIEVDPETHAVTSRASVVGVVFIVAILALRMVLRSSALEGHAALGVPAIAITDALVLLLGAMIVTQNLEMWLRARGLLEAARVAKSTAGTVAD